MHLSRERAVFDTVLMTALLHRLCIKQTRVFDQVANIDDSVMTAVMIRADYVHEPQLIENMLNLKKFIAIDIRQTL